ncbi:hypothetical protein ACJJTC_009420 [Scirpophaga incertulas]
MLKWAVYGKKTQDVQPNQTPDGQLYSHEPYNSKIRRSLDAQTVKKTKKPSRYQRRSIGATARKNNIKTVDKENLNYNNYIGHTPNYFKEGFIKKYEGLALKDVSNITPSSVTPIKNYDRRKYQFDSKEEIPPDLPPTPPTYSRRVREAKKRKLEMTINNTECFRRNSSGYKSERRIKPINKSLLTSFKLCHSTSEPSLIDLSERLNAALNDSNRSFRIHRNKIGSSISTIRNTHEEIAEIEYDEDLIINCVEKPLPLNKTNIDKITLPIFGNHIFMDNPLYFNKNRAGFTSIRPLKRTRKKSNEFESSFKSPTVDKKDANTLLRDGCSPISITPLSIKLAALRFSTMSTHNKSQLRPYVNDEPEYFTKIENPFTIPTIKDDEVSVEMENKFILSKESVSNVTESTVSTTQMGDITLEKMIEDIIKSTKIIKTRRKILNNECLTNLETVQDEIPPLKTVKDLFVNPQADIKTNLIKEAKYVNLSRESSISPKTTPVKKMMPVHRVNENLIRKLPIGCFILDDGDGYNEREVRTPDCVKDNDLDSNIKHKTSKNILNRSCSMNISSTDKSNLENVMSESTPDLFGASRDIINGLRRQKCIRRKKSTVSNESYKRQRDLDAVPGSFLTLDSGIPSPALELQNVSMCEALSTSFNYIAAPPYRIEFANIPSDNLSINSNVSHSSLMPHEIIIGNNQRSKELFGLTLENGIPSPITPVPRLKRSSNVLSEERAHKTTKVEDDLLSTDIVTPVLEHKSSRRCLTYSPEESCINSSEEKRRSIVSNALEQSSERLQSLKGTIDLEIKTRNDIIDVHVIRCRDLQRCTGKTDDINAYTKVVISGVTENNSLPSQRSVFQRTSVLYGKREPEFQRHLKLPVPSAVYDHQILHISVWHRDKKYRRSEFLGCISFPLKDAISTDVAGTYFLQQGSSRQAAQAAPSERSDRVTENRRKMATDNIETSTNDGTKENQNDKGVAANGPASTTTSQAQAVAAALQREADEHLFLRYLELDPPEDPNAPRRAQRNGRTPFTTTRKLTRGAGGGFGFTVVWTRPPRVERVAAGGSAERAGLRAGDYLVFVGNKNVVTAPEEEVRNLVKSAGQLLTLETFRRVPQNGATMARPRVVAAEAPRSPRSPAPARPPTACSSSQSLDRRKLHLPQVTFSKEVGNGIIV